MHQTNRDTSRDTVISRRHIVEQVDLGIKKKIHINRFCDIVKRIDLRMESASSVLTDAKFLNGYFTR